MSLKHFVIDSSISLHYFKPGAFNNFGFVFLDEFFDTDLIIIVKFLVPEGKFNKIGSSFTL